MESLLLSIIDKVPISHIPLIAMGALAFYFFNKKISKDTESRKLTRDDEVKELQSVANRQTEIITDLRTDSNNLKEKMLLLDKQYDVIEARMNTVEKLADKVDVLTASVNEILGFIRGFDTFSKHRKTDFEGK